jgi:LuxR family transcriptional regulator, quorum-sensing system regulator BjaR1
MTPATPLTTREAQCVAYVADGKTDVEIGRLLQISPRTSRFHVENARRKFGATNRPMLIAKMREVGDG